MLKATIHNKDISVINTHVTNNILTIFIMHKLQEV